MSGHLDILLHTSLYERNGDCIMIKEIATFTILGLPVVVYGGMVTLTAFAVTAYIGYTNKIGKGKISFKWHPRMVIISFIIALIHAFFAMSLFIG
jgi:hypothetical protein